MSFVTVSDFNQYPYKLPTIGKTPDLFQGFIDQQEALYLLELLGDNLYNAFINGLAALPPSWVSTVETVIGNQYVYGNNIWQALTAQTGTAPVAGVNWLLVESGNRWLELKNGATYTYDSLKYKWPGMVAMLKPLIYSTWIESKALSNTDNGFLIPKVENNTVVNPMGMICRSWNAWVRIAGGPCAQKGTLFGYLYNTNEESGTFDDTFDETFTSFVDYLAHEFKIYSFKNTFGI